MPPQAVEVVAVDDDDGLPLADLATEQLGAVDRHITFVQMLVRHVASLRQR